MARLKKPAISVEGHRNSKSQLKNRAKKEAQMKGDSDLLDKPPKFNTDELSKYYYDRLVEYTDSSVYGNVDRFGLGLIAMTLANIDYQQQQMLAEGENGKPKYIFPVEDKNGQVIMKPNPLVSMQRNNIQQFTKLASQYGLSPTSRASLSSEAKNARYEANSPLLKAMMEDDD